MDSAKLSSSTTKASSLRWKILRQALLHRSSSSSSSSSSDSESQTQISRISRKPNSGFNLIPCCNVLENNNTKDSSFLKANELSPPRLRDARFCYTLPVDGSPQLILTQRVENHTELSDFEICNRYDIDNTGLVCQWPSEDILAYFCLSHPEIFRSKRVIELGAGYGLAGLVIAATSLASEVVISDGNPQVVDYIQHNIDANCGVFGGTNVKSLLLHWNGEEILNLSDSFDLIIASDCTFFKEFHKGLVRAVKLLLKDLRTSEAIFFSPKRGDSLDKFLEEVKESGLQFSITEKYDAEVWKLHETFVNGDDTWPSYVKDHCYPIMIRVTH